MQIEGISISVTATRYKLTLFLSRFIKMSTRPRRLAAKRTKIIEVSDSEDSASEANDNDEYKPTETRRRFIDRAAATVASGA